MSNGNENKVLPSEGFVKLKDVLEFIPVSKSTWYEMIANGRAPKPIKLGSRSSFWRVEDIRLFIQNASNDAIYHH